MNTIISNCALMANKVIYWFIPMSQRQNIMQATLRNGEYVVIFWQDFHQKKPTQNPLSVLQCGMIEFSDKMF